MNKLQIELNKYMTDNDLNISELARYLNAGYATCHDWLTGKGYPRPKKLDELSEKLRTPVANLIGDSEHELGGEYYSFAKRLQQDGASKDDIERLWDIYSSMKGLKR